MAKILIATIVVALATSALAQSCNSTVTASNPFHRSNCTGYTACEIILCGCAGVTNASTANAGMCLSYVPAATTCTAMTTCMSAFTTCLSTLAGSDRTNSSSSCYMWALSMHASMLTTSVSAFNGSMHQRACASLACQVRNVSGKDSCAMGANFSAVCNPTTVFPTGITGPTPVPATLPPNVVAAITARIRINGAAFAALLNGNAAARASLAVAVASDLAGLLGIDAAYIYITNMYLGSLVVEFTVSTAAGVQPTLLNTRLARATTENWLTSTQSVYSTVSNETLTVTEAPVTLSSAPPGLVTPQPPTTAAATVTPAPTTTVASISASTGVVSAVASIVAVAAAVLAL
jgi:hypothetical protein